MKIGLALGSGGSRGLAHSSDMKTVLATLFDPALHTGLIKGEKVNRFLREHPGDFDISSLLTTFVLVATDSTKKEPVVFERGIGWDSFWKPAQVIDDGEQATTAMLSRILERLRR